MVHLQSIQIYENLKKVPVDVDVVMFANQKNFNAERDIKSLIKSVRQSLIEIYPNKLISEFKMSSKASTINFTGTRLSVDIVPVIEDNRLPEFGLQYDLKNNCWFKTCPTGQVKFIQETCDREPEYRRLVRMAKKWRNHIELKSLTSYMIELIMAKSTEKTGNELILERLLELRGNKPSIMEKFQNFLLYLARIQPNQRIEVYGGRFAIMYGNIGFDTSLKTKDTALEIPDPFCSENNVASHVNEVDRKKIIKAAKKSWELSLYASVRNDANVWNKKFGFNFNKILKIRIICNQAKILKIR